MTLTPPIFHDFSDAYTAVLRRIHISPQYQTRRRGEDATTVPNISFRLADPTRRLVFLAARRANIALHYAEALWSLLGRDDRTMLGYYAPPLTVLSSDGAPLTGTASGQRLALPAQPDWMSRFDQVIDLLHRDPDSQRAGIPITRADPDNPDLAGTLGLHLTIRDGRPHLSAYLYGCDAVLGLPGDTFAFTVVQEYAARRLQVPVGTYTHHVRSMRLNIRDLDTVAAVLAEADHGPAPVFTPMPMPATTTRDLEQVLLWEHRLRTNHAGLSVTAAHAVPLDPYWRRVLLLFEAYRQIRHTAGSVTAEVAAALDDGHRWLLAARWPERITAASAAWLGPA